MTIPRRNPKRAQVMDAGDIAQVLAETFQSRDQAHIQAKVEPGEFIKVLARMTSPLVIMEEAGVIREKYVYVTIYRGVTIVTTSKSRLTLPKDVDTIEASNINGLD